MSRRLLLPALFLALSGCAQTAEVLGRRTLTDDGHPSGWYREIRETARDSYLYAQLALDAYRGGDALTLPDYVVRDTVLTDERTGFAAAVYTVDRPAGPETVIAYRGTEGPLFVSLDWRRGNYTTQQSPLALDLFDAVRDTLGDVPVTVTGHSLGGALALHVSLRRERAPAYVFNTSSRFTAGPGVENRRVSVAQYFEVNKVLRALAREPSGTHTTLNCTGRLGAFYNHGVRSLAECLTQIAATEDDEALASLALNGIDPKYPRRATAP